MFPQRSSEWYAARKGRITGSVAGAALGLNPWMTPDDLIRKMVRDYHGAPSEFTGNAATEWGKANEANVKFAYEMETGNTVEECGFFEYEDWLGASPDGLVGAAGLVEFKAPYSLRNGGEFKPLEEQPHYYAQIQIELLCTCRLRCDFVQWSPVLPLDIERVDVDAFWLNENLLKLRAFHERYLSELNNPEHLQPKRPVVRSVAAQQLVDEYQELVDAIARAEERRKDVLAELVKLSGEKNAQIGDYKLTKVERKGSVKYAEVVKKHLPDLDLSPYTSEKTTYWTLK